MTEPLHPAFQQTASLRPDQNAEEFAPIVSDWGILTQNLNDATQPAADYTTTPVRPVGRTPAERRYYRKHR